MGGSGLVRCRRIHILTPVGMNVKGGGLYRRSLEPSLPGWKPLTFRTSGVTWAFAQQNRSTSVRESCSSPVAVQSTSL